MTHNALIGNKNATEANNASAKIRSQQPQSAEGITTTTSLPGTHFTAGIELERGVGRHSPAPGWHVVIERGRDESIST